MPREILQITPETTFGSYNSAGTHTAVDLPRSNSFTMRDKPNPYILRSAASDNKRTQYGSFTADIMGKLMMRCTPNNAALLASMISSLTGTCPTLPSYTIDHAIAIEDGSCTYKYTRYLGVMADGGFTMDNSPDGCIMTFDLDLMAAGISTAITISDFPTPAYTAYNWATPPFAFQDTLGGLSIAGSSRANFSSIAYKAGNHIKAFRGESKYVTRIACFGRDPSITIKNLYQAEADRIAYRAITETALSITYTDALTDTLVLAFGANNYFSAVEDDLPIDNFHMQTITLENLLDPATGTDMSITYTVHS